MDVTKYSARSGCGGEDGLGGEDSACSSGEQHQSVVILVSKEEVEKTPLGPLRIKLISDLHGKPFGESGSLVKHFSGSAEYRCEHSCLPVLCNSL